MRSKRALVALVAAAFATMTPLLGPGSAAIGAPEAPNAPKASAKSKVILDVDMGQFNDDAVAMFMLAQSDENTDVLGVTTVAGNTWVEEGIAYSLRQLELVREADIPVVPGAGDPLMGSRQPVLDAEEELFGNSQYLGSGPGSGRRRTPNSPTNRTAGTRRPSRPRRRPRHSSPSRSRRTPTR